MMFEELIDPIEEKTRQIKERIALFKITYPWVNKPERSLSVNAIRHETSDNH